MIKEDSLKKRYFYKLFTNLTGLVISVVTMGIIPRGLGPKAYGDFNFLSNFFSQIVSFFDMGTSICFYTNLSKRPKESGLVTFYFYFIGIVSVITIAFVFINHLTSAYVYIWPEQAIYYIYLAVGWGILVWIMQIFNQMTDAYALTVPAEFAKLFQKVLGMILIVLLYVSHQLNLRNFFYYQYIILLILCGVFIWVIKNRGYNIKFIPKLSPKQVKDYTKEFYNYSHPLFVYSLIGLIVNIADRWLLQIYGGSIQQGFFGLSYQIGAVCFLFTSAMTPLLWREFSIAFENKDIAKMASLFRRYIPLLYSMTAYFTCFIVLQSDKVIYILGGQNYMGAFMAVTIMAFYPLHQTYGQLSGSVFYATGETRLYRNIGIIVMLIGLPLTYFLIAPKEQFGLNAGATGLAIKMVAINFISVNILLFFNAKQLNLPFWRYVGHQIFSVGCLLSVATMAKLVIDYILGLSQNVIASFILAGVLYTLLAVILVYKLPVVFGLKKQDIQSMVKTLLFYKEKSK